MFYLLDDLGETCPSPGRVLRLHLTHVSHREAELWAQGLRGLPAPAAVRRAQSLSVMTLRDVFKLAHQGKTKNAN